MNFRVLTIDDFDQIAVMEKNYKTSIGEARPSQDGLACLKQAIEHEEIKFYGAEDNGKIIGICSIVKIYSTFRFEYLGMLEDFYVQITYRKKGIAKQLIDFAWKASRCRTLGVFCGDENIEILHKLGFTFPIENCLLKF